MLDSLQGRTLTAILNNKGAKVPHKISERKAPLKELLGGAERKTLPGRPGNRVQIRVTDIQGIWQEFSRIMDMPKDPRLHNNYKAAARQWVEKFRAQHTSKIVRQTCTILEMVNPSIQPRTANPDCDCAEAVAFHCESLKNFLEKNYEHLDHLSVKSALKRHGGCVSLKTIFADRGKDPGLDHMPAACFFFFSKGHFSP
uniref:Uncharacterized protein n=1 Tax=Branchiostoma floridae TaxID=7739 RepID=C3Z199_BRAFL|eukprot:XP_002597786.1 hypothetical protein BRAFLDRAFT_77310 [Branchiostoma floridae]